MVKKERRQGRGKGRRRVVGLSLLSCTRQADLDSKCQIEKQPLWPGPAHPHTTRLYSQ